MTTPEELVEAAYSEVKDPDPSLLTTLRAPLVAGYANKQGIEALLSLLLQKLLVDRPDDPVGYLVDVLKEWNPRMVVILGPPASGKYTLADLLADRLALEHVSPNDLVEGMMASDTILGDEMKKYRESGENVPDELVETVVLARLRERDCRDKGWVMDGWPRTADQAQRLVDERLMPQIGVVLKADDATIEDRVSFRIENPSTGRLYHHKLDPPPLGEQRDCITRPGEAPEEIQGRLQVYNSSISSILQRLGQSDREWRVLELDVSSTRLDEYRLLGEQLARRIGV